MKYSRALEQFRRPYREMPASDDKPLTPSAKLPHSYCGGQSRIGYDGKSPRLRTVLPEL